MHISLNTYQGQAPYQYQGQAYKVIETIVIGRMIEGF